MSPELPSEGNTAICWRKTKVRNAAEWCGIAIKCLGALVLLLYLLGVFRDKARIHVYERIRDGYSVAIQSPAVQDLLDYLDARESERSTIVAVQRPEPTIGRVRGDDVVAIHPDRSTTRIADITQVDSWSSQESFLYLWISFSLVAVGVLIDILLKLVPPLEPPTALET